MKTQLFNQMKARYERFKKHQAAFDPGADSWFRIKSQDTDHADVYIYDAIGFHGVEAQTFVEEFDEIESSRITLRINSPGGDVFDGMAIFNAIKRHNATVTTEIDGLAASMASIIALAGDTVNMHDLGLFMIHEPWSMVVGNADDMRSEADLLDKVRDQGIDIYRSKSNLDDTELRAAMSAETWYTASEAYDAGFVHNIIETEPDQSSGMFDLSMFDNPPSDRCIPGDPRNVRPSRRSMEQSLRNAGLSRRDAKALVAGGLSNIGEVFERNADVDLLRQSLNHFYDNMTR
jgi:ATP-dependent protease ClpP protease subunit